MPVNADLAVGALEETVTVSGEAPVVDVKSSRAQTRYSVHGGPEAQPYVDGMNQQLPNSTQGVFVYNQLNIQEVVVETSGVGSARSLIFELRKDI